MKTKEIIKTASELAKPFRISKGENFRLKDVDPDDTLDFTKEADKPRAKEALVMGVTALAELQDKLYAQDKWAVLLIFQAMASWCENFFYTFQRRSRNDDSLSESMIR